jgi:hypothetical protein
MNFGVLCLVGTLHYTWTQVPNCLMLLASINFNQALPYIIKYSTASTGVQALHY